MKKLKKLIQYCYITNTHQNNSTSSDFDEDPIISSIFSISFKNDCNVDQPSKKQKLQEEDEDYKLAKSLQVCIRCFIVILQIAEYMNSIKENQIQKEKKNQMPISYYYKMTVDKEMKDDVEIIDYDLKNMESKNKSKLKSKSKEKIEEEKRLTTLNVFCLINLLISQIILIMFFHHNQNYQIQHQIFIFYLK